MQNDPSGKEKIYSQADSGKFSEKAVKKQKKVFCPVCGRKVSLSFLVAGLCKDCFNND